jgi:PTS system galactosamine-specific IIB component
MAEINIVFSRIDNRLVHGQVGMVWANTMGANILVVVDDDVVNDQVQQELMRMTVARNNLPIRFWSTQQTIDTIGRASPSQKIFIITKTPKTMRKLVEGGVPIKAVNIGNMHTSAGKRQYKTAYVYVDDEDMADLDAMKAKGVQLSIQVLPDYKKVVID